jgi:hypothetical protein
LFAMTKRKGDINKKSEALQGTLDLMILKTLQERETEDWERISGVIDRLLRLEGQR